MKYETIRYTLVILSLEVKLAYDELKNSQRLNKLSLNLLLHEPS
jgi:hypothetical protein